MLGDGVRIYDQDHFFNNYTFSRRITQSEKVSIGARCWIGANSIITKGVKIGDNVIIGAGSVITKDIPSNTIVYGKKNLIIKNRPQAKYHALILTASEHLEHIAELLKTLPKMDFHIAAYTDMGAGLMELHSYQNCQLYPKVHLDYSLKSLIEKADIYLDINHGIELDNIVEQILSLEKPVLSFETTNHRPEDERIRSFEQVDQMVIAIKEIIERKSKNK
nr:DapH/DapD/GlmU-related protein [Streptococcus loxodontisalivarius]